MLDLGLQSNEVNRHPRAAPKARRLSWALEKSGHLLAEALRKDTSAEAREVEKLPQEKIPGELVSLIMEKADPTQNKGMTTWLVRQYAQGKLRLEDLGTANETLTMFRRYEQRLEPGERDLGQYSSLAAVWETVIGFANGDDQHLSGKAQKALDRDKAYAESRILRQDEDGFTIAVPLTEFAAKWWGRGTRWCTAAEKENQFWQYHKDAPLIVIVIPGLGDRGKFQLWAGRDTAVFSDVSDGRPSASVIAMHWARFSEVFRCLIQDNAWVLRVVHHSLQTYALCELAVRQNGMLLGWVAEDLITQELCEAALRATPASHRHLPLEYRTADMYRIALEQDGMLLDEIPSFRLDEKLCSVAVRQNGLVLARVPTHLRSQELCLAAVQQNSSAIAFVPPTLRSHMERSLPPHWSLSVLDAWQARLCLKEAPVESRPNAMDGHLRSQ
jgi:hypothetical protein